MSDPFPCPRGPGGGFTLLEVLVVLSVSLLMSALGLPTWQQWMAGRSADQATQELAEAVRRGRSEAMARGEVVTLCPRDPDSPVGAAVCRLDSHDWSGGWLLFVDRGVRGELEADDLLIVARHPGTAGPKVTATLERISFQPSGISLSAASHFDVVPAGAPGAPAAWARRLCINKPGRVRQLPGGVNCEGHP